MAYKVVKQMMPAPTSSVDRDGNSFDDPWWVERNNIWVSKISGSDDQLWQYSGSDALANATAKMNALTGSDSSGRLYKVVEV
tara:strand:+ start:501 stop:746 length:246 start_codon:yes stop_codon:yes gene_type:complete